jgi:hypothetical protein
MGVKELLGRFARNAVRVTYARVMVAATALVLLGGGYSLALSGTGTLQKENEVGLTPDAEETIRAIRGIGPLIVQCNTAGGGPGQETLDLEIVNNSAKTLKAYTDRADSANGVMADPATSFANSGSGMPLTGGLAPDQGDEGVFRVHVFPSDGSKRPQADVIVGYAVGTNACLDAQVSILNLTTEE